MVMSFKKAVDDLCAGISHKELAEALGVSVATVRQARLREGAEARRSPPNGWEKIVARLAKGRSEHLRNLSAKLARDSV